MSMTMGEIYRRAIQIGIDNDWRGPECIEGILAKAREEAETPGFDAERLSNPYGDSRIAWGDPDTQVRSVLVGIDIGPSELLLAGLMRQASTPVDMCLAHHTTCINRGLYYYDDILLTHKYALAEIDVAESDYGPVVDEWAARVEYSWKLETINTARNLNMPLMNIHTPCDLMRVRHTRETFANMPDATLGEIAAELNAVEEIASTPYEEVIVHGDPGALPGKVYDATGAGWRPLIGLFEMACRADIDTAVLVSPNEDYFRMAADYGVTIVELPHNSVDNYGINRMLDELVKIEPLTIYDAHNFRRFPRVG